jgi:hypothetical protein
MRIIGGSITGVVAGDNITVTRASTGDAANATVAASPYPIVGTLIDPGGRLANYYVSNPNGSLTVTKASITVVNTNRSKVFGETLTNADFAGSITGVVAGDNITVTRSSTGQGAAATVAGSPYPIVGTLVDPGGRLPNYNVTNTNGVLTVTTKAACGSYNGVLFANTATGATSATIKLSVVYTESSLPVADLSTAVVTFTVDGSTYTAIRDASASGTNYSTFYYNYAASLGTQPSHTYEVSWAISGNYTDAGCPDHNSEVTVSIPTSDFVTGGGYIILGTTTSGKYAGDPGSKTNFGFSVKYNKTLTNVQGGGINALIRKGTHLYQIKGNKVTALTVVPGSPTTAGFTSNAVVNEIINGVAYTTTDPAPNATVEISDVCEPGSGAAPTADLIAITVKDKMAFCYSPTAGFKVNLLSKY